MKKQISGNVVTRERVFFGTVTITGEKISALDECSPPEPGADWVLPGFIDLHLHGLGPGNVVGETGLRDMAEFGPSTGLTGFLPTYSAAPMEELLAYADGINSLMRKPCGTLVLGAHLEGPFIAPSHKGGMGLNRLSPPDLSRLETLLAALDGHLRLMTLSPELDGIDEIIRRLCVSGTVVAAGHTGCTPERLAETIEMGLSHICHLFDTFDGRIVHRGVSQLSLADAVLIDDRLSVEVIVDGCHVPPGLIELTRRAIGPDRFIAVTDSQRGAGMPDGIYVAVDGTTQYSLSAENACRRLKDNALIGSCLTMNYAFHNLVSRFNFSPVAAALATATNAARKIGIDGETGSIEVGKRADIAVIDAGNAAVHSCFIAGNEVYSRR